MLEDYLNQCCFLRRVEDTDTRGQPILSEPRSVPCRLQQKFQLIQKANGETIPAEHICYLRDTVSVGDTINEQTVHAVNDWTDLDGEKVGYKAVM